MTPPLVVLIAACGQPALLRRTLQSIVERDKPKTYAGVIVIENGPRSGLDRVIAEFSPAQRFQYLYSQPPNKSAALNQALATMPEAFVVFTDDDVIVPQRTLAAYAEAATACGGGAFFGGPIIPDYESEPPPAWLRRYLPRSAAGWQLDVTEKTQILQPEFIGPNFAAFARDILRVGGFDTRLGPGRHMVSPGEDTEIQERLLVAGVRGYYLPNAPMQHRVRHGTASPDFAIDRAERNGIYWGISQSRQAGYFPRRWAKLHGQWLNDRLRIARWRRQGDEETAFRARFTEARWRGRWTGLRLGWNWDKPQKQPLPNLVPELESGAAHG